MRGQDQGKQMGGEQYKKLRSEFMTQPEAWK
jgi:hypothetical protein